jgi:(p)ppGpp synthase/HD superfamily hydrolase
MRDKALQFATRAHEGQTRKDGYTPYITHPIGVAKIVELHGGDDDHHIAALLHDVVEDCDVTLNEIRKAFGDKIADLVRGLTNTSKQDMPHLNRAQRKALDNERLAKESLDVKLVKLADIYYNVNDLGGFNRGFAFRFLEEKRTQAEAVREGSEHLYQKVIESIDRQLNRLNQEGK